MPVYVSEEFLIVTRGGWLIQFNVLYFSGYFGALEETVDGQVRSKTYGIATYGISMTTLEEVFLKLGMNIRAGKCYCVLYTSIGTQANLKKPIDSLQLIAVIILLSL